MSSRTIQWMFVVLSFPDWAGIGTPEYGLTMLESNSLSPVLKVFNESEDIFRFFSDVFDSKYSIVVAVITATAAFLWIETFAKILQ